MKIGVIGAGNWGTALSNLLADKGLSVTLWAYEKEVAESINSNHKNALYFNEFELNPALRATADMEEAVVDKDMVVFVVPSHVARITAKKAAAFIKKEAVLVSCTKGIETETGKLISDVLMESIPALPADNFCFLSGPSFAREVAKKLPTTVVIAGNSAVSYMCAQNVFRTDYFMTFTSEDVIGVQVGGAVKNVVAVACGISDGLGFGHNTRAATITRGLYEMIKIGQALGANPITFSGLAGVGDLILTCTSELSRNHQVGLEIGRGKVLSQIQKGTHQIAEGIATAKAIKYLAKKYNFITPICSEVYKILYEGKQPREAVKDLTQLKLHEELRGIN